MIQVGNLAVNLDTCRVLVDGKELHLTGKEYGAVELLSRRKGTTVTKEMLLDHLCGGMDEPELAMLHNFVAKLRQKLAGQPEANTTSRPCGGTGTLCGTPPI